MNGDSMPLNLGFGNRRGCHQLAESRTQGTARGRNL